MRLVRNLVVLAAGATVGTLFAQRSGKELRDALSKSKDPWALILKEAGSMGSSVKDSTVDWVKNSKELQQVIESGKGQFDELVKGAKDVGGETAATAKKKLEELAKNAQAAAKELSVGKKLKPKKKASGAKSAAKKAVKSTATKTKTVAKKATKPAVKKVAKKTTAAVKKKA